MGCLSLRGERMPKFVEVRFRSLAGCTSARRAFPYVSCQRQRGQALVLALACILVLIVGVLVLFNTGQAVSTKVQLVNAADAAAYSAAVEQARAYNLVSYMNRAEVANEVAVAQIVTLYSMTNYLLSATDTLRKVARDLEYAFYVAAIFTEGGTIPIANAFQKANSALSKAKSAIKKARNGMQQPFSVAVKFLSALNQAYSTATAAIVTIAPGDASLLANTVVKKNTDGKAKIGARGLLLLTEQYGEAEHYTKRYSLSKTNGNAAGANRFANVVMEARDGFSRERNADTIFGIIKKRGGTDVVTSSRAGRYYDSFVAADTLDFYLNLPWWMGGDIDLPLAWGGAAATKSTQGGFSRVALQGYKTQGRRGWYSPYTSERGLHIDRYGGAVDNHKAGKKVRNDPADNATSKGWLKGYTGLHDYDDIVADKATMPYLNGKSADQNGVKALSVGPIFTVAIEQPTNTVRTTSNVNGIGGPPDFEVPDETIKDNMTALSSAQVYFDRPRGLFDNIIDSRREMGSLFSPYWQARLVDTPCSIRQAVAVSYGSLAPCI